MKALVIGAARSGIAAARLLHHQHYEVLVSDTKFIPDAERKPLLDLGGITFHHGPQSSALLHGVDLVVASPGVDPQIELIRSAVAQGTTVTTEVFYALQHYSGPWISITGTNGKSTTTVMVAHLLQHLGYPVVAGGNLGLPACEIILNTPQASPLVLELSSYQLQYPIPRAPDIAIFTSFSADHLGRHGSLDNYFSAKWQLFAAPQTTRILASEVAPFVTRFGHAMAGCVLAKDDDQLSALVNLAPHDRSNASCALAAAAAFTGKPIPELAGYFADFCGLPHRFQTIGHNGTCAIINDSKATNVDSTLTALAGVKGDPVILMLGGQGKGESFAPILQKSTKIKSVVAFGHSGRTITQELCHGGIKVFTYPSLATALIHRAEWWQTNTTILFSPACASFDEFLNFEDRGEFFVKQVQQWSELEQPDADH